MQNYKAVILGPQCSGKTTLTKYLEQNFQLPLIEEDDLFTQLNGGEYPQDIEYKEKTLRPQLEDKIRNAESMIFLTSYCNRILLQELKDKGYKVIQLELDDEEFQKRNEKRMREQGYADANTWAKEVFGFHKDVKEKGMVDKGIDVKQPIENIAKELLEFLNL
jgi:adenylate kinase family enzyme